LSIVHGAEVEKDLFYKDAFPAVGYHTGDMPSLNHGYTWILSQSLSWMKRHSMIADGVTGLYHMRLIEISCLLPASHKLAKARMVSAWLITP
jgi:hypothetical protein